MTVTHTEEDVTARVAPLTYVLEEAWRAIQEQHPEIPNVVVVVGPVSLSGRADRYGHYAPDRWTARGEHKRAEVLISAEGLARWGRQVFRTLLHESVHASCNARGLKDCTLRGIHNATFREQAESFGLVCGHEPGIGCTTPDITDETAATYAAVILRIERTLLTRRDESSPDPDALARAVAFMWAAWGHGWQVNTGGEGAYGLVPRTRPRSRIAGDNAVKVTCPCGRSVRAYRATLEAGPITCSLCEGEFV